MYVKATDNDYAHRVRTVPLRKNTISVSVCVI